MPTPTVEDQILADLANMTWEEWLENMEEADKASRELDVPDPWEERLRESAPLPNQPDAGSD